MDHHVAILAVDGKEGMDMEKAQKQQQQLLLVRERGLRIKAAAELGLARASRGRQWGRALGRRALVVATAASKDPYYPIEFEVTPSTTEAGGDRAVQEKAASPEGEEEEEEMVEEKVALLRRLVPGGEDMAVEGLLEETVDYIEALKAQVGVMRTLACLLSGSGIDDLPVPGKAAAGLLAPEKHQ